MNRDPDMFMESLNEPIEAKNHFVVYTGKLSFIGQRVWQEDLGGENHTFKQVGK